MQRARKMILVLEICDCSMDRRLAMCLEITPCYRRYSLLSKRLACMMLFETETIRPVMTSRHVCSSIFHSQS